MRKLIAVCCALALALGAGAAYYLQAPTDAALREMARENPVAEGRLGSALWKSPSMLAEMAKACEAEGRRVCFALGSSEFSYAVEDAAHPVRFFQENDCGFELITVGGAGYQSLWNAIEVGALDEEGALPDGKIVLLLGTCWFMEGGCTPEAFLNSFSEEAFGECMRNARIAPATKEQIRDRVVALGVDAQLAHDLSDGSVVAYVNRAARDILGGGERRARLAEALSSNAPLEEDLFGSDDEVDWDALAEQAEREGAAACTNNEYGIYDDYFDEYMIDQPWEENYQGDPFNSWSDTEFGDLQLFLRVCSEVGVDPLVVIEPSNGWYYDLQPYNKESRSIFYDRLKELLSDAGVDYLDLSIHDYDKYYLRDVMHLGWKGWAEIDRAICEFYGEGGGGSREAEPLANETNSERDAAAAADEMLEVEGAGTEIVEGEDRS